MSQRIFITGAGGYIGRLLLRKLGRNRAVYGLDIREDMTHTPPIHAGDIRDPNLAKRMQEQQITHVVHLASILESSGDPARDYDIDVNGTQNVIEACLAAGVQHLTIASSGAAYGYHPDNPTWITEDAPLRGNDIFPYAKHKRIVEHMLARYRTTHPELQQLILRPGTVLGHNTDNLITNLFTKKRVLAIRGSETRFVFIWDEDVVNIMQRGVEENRTGIYNLAGTGAIPIRTLATLLNKPVLDLPPTLLRIALTIGRATRTTRYGPEQLKFLQYRPVLDNRALIEDFGYTPQKTSKETFLYWLKHAQERGVM